MDECRLNGPANPTLNELDDASSSSNDGESDEFSSNELTQKQAWCLYTSHLLSMWTSRAYEYMTILFIQYAFPGDLLPSSINGITETVCVLVSSAALGRWVDQSSSRLKPLMTSILVNRVTLIVCCIVWLFMFANSNAMLLRAIFVVILALGMVEKASRMSNTLSVERDWIPTIASYGNVTEGLVKTSYDLTHLNTVVQRIDIICKFTAPLAISSLMAVVRPWTAAALVGGFGLLSCLAEVWGIVYVWKSNKRLQRSKSAVSSGTVQRTTSRGSILSRLSFIPVKLVSLIRIQASSLNNYFGSDVWIPSLVIAFLHASVLTWSGTLITWLLNSGFTYTEMAISKGIGSVFELGSTFIFPFAVECLLRRDDFADNGGSYQLVDVPTNARGEKQIDDGEADDSQVKWSSDTVDAVVVTARWSILGLIVCLFPALAALLVLDRKVDGDANLSRFAVRSKRLIGQKSAAREHLDLFTVSPIAMIVFLTFLSLSFLGRWTYNLSISQLTQIAIPARRRSEFGGTEMAIVSLISLSHWVAATVWHRQTDFKWLAVGSVGAVTVAAGGYCFWSIKWRQKNHRRARRLDL